MVKTTFILTNGNKYDAIDGNTVTNQIVIPNEVTKENLKQLIVGSNVTIITKSQFEGYRELITLNLQGASNLKTISQKAFFNCDKLMSVADYDEDAIVSNIDDIIVIPETVTYIGKDAFTVQIDDFKFNKNLYIRGTKKYQKYLKDTTQLTWLGRENNYFFMDEFKYNGNVNYQFNSRVASFSSTFSKTPYFPPNMLAKVKDDEIPFTMKIVNGLANYNPNTAYPLKWRLNICVRTNGIGNDIKYSLIDYEVGKNVILVKKDGKYGDFKGSLVRFYNSDGILAYDVMRGIHEDNEDDIYTGAAIFKKSENGRSAELQGYFNTKVGESGNLPNYVNNYEITIKAELFNKTKKGKILFKNDSRFPYGYTTLWTMMDACFPGNSQLILKDGTKKLFHDVQYGDEVQVCSKEMELSYSKVTFLPHLQNDQLTAFIKFITESNQTIRVTSKHLLPILNKNNTLQNIMAEDITKEDKLYVLNNVQGTPEAIKSIERIVEEGAYTAYIQNGEYLVVDNVVASPYAMNHNLFNILNKIINGLDNVGLMVVISPVIRVLEGVLYGAFKGLGLMRYIEDKR